MENLKNKVANILLFIQSSQLNGEFKSLCFLPFDKDNSEWYYSGKSPFLTANILYCLLDSNKEANAILNDGADFLLSIKQQCNLWRYWDHNNGVMEYNVPNDVDDSCLVSFILKKIKNVEVDNKKIIIANLRDDSYFKTWILPSHKNIVYPKIFYYLVKDFIKSKKVFLPNKKIPNNENISSIFDNESAVDCTAILYLNEKFFFNPLIENITNEINNDKIRLQYYDQPHFTYYHLSRVYKERKFKVSSLKTKIINYAKNFNFEYSYNENYLEYIVLFNTLINFGFTDNPTYNKLSSFLVNDPMLNGDWKPFKYWTSKQRSWWAGSPALTAALYYEGLSKLLKR